MATISYQGCLQRVADALHVTVSQLGQDWVSLSAEATKDALADILTALALKGYGSQTAQGADQLAIWVERLAFCYVVSRGAALTNYNLESLKTLNPMEMIERSTAILINGVPTAPQVGESEVGGISSGVNTHVANEFRRLDRRGNRCDW